MTKQFSSKFSTDQLIQLSKQVLNPTDIRHVNALMRAHVTGSTPNWNRQELIAFIAARNGGTPPDQILENMAAAALRKQTSSTLQQDGGGAVLRYIDLSAPKTAPQNPYIVVAVQCHGNCGQRVHVTVGDLNKFGVAYCPRCAPAAAAAIQPEADMAKAYQDFLEQVPQFYPSPTNIQMISNEIERRKVARVTPDVLLDIYLALRPQLLGRLTPEDVRAMTSVQYEARLQQDPGMGGVNLDEAHEGQKRGEATIHSSNKQRFGQSFERTGVSSRVGG
jgi:hypothetical protein